MKHHTSLISQQQSNQELDFFIQPIKQKVFDFNASASTALSGLAKVNKLKSYKNQERNWKPTICKKKTMDDPKFIMSMERKKARIISGLRDQQVDQKYHEREKGFMTGSKLKQFDIYRYNYKPCSQQERQEIETHKPLKAAQSSSKNKKIPYMGFSLKLITKNKKKTESRNSGYASMRQNTLNREKGSNAVYQYEHILLTQSLLDTQKKSKDPATGRSVCHRPKTGSQRQKASNQRPQTSIPYYHQYLTKRQSDGEAKRKRPNSVITH